MHIEIWSDVFCPYCYIGKRNFEAALADFPEKSGVTVHWRSFQLAPNAQYEPGLDGHAALARHLSVLYDTAKAMNRRVTDMARAEGLDFDTEQLKWANSFDAHRLIQFARAQGCDSAVKSRLFAAVFTLGENISDHDTLVRIAAECGLDAEATRDMLATDACADTVREDMREATALGISGVPFFVIDRKYGFSGAAPVEHFSRMLADLSAKNGTNPTE